MVIDASAIIAVFMQESHGEWAAEQMNRHSHQLKMCTVNLTEVLIHLLNHQPKLYPQLEDQLFSMGIRFFSPDVERVRLAAKTRLKFPLNLGDCFAYSLAVQENCPILTLDKGFLKTDCPLIFPHSH